MLHGTPPGTLGLATPSGWMNSELFPEVMRHFIQHSCSSKENPSLLLLDNHESHLSIESLELAKTNGVTMLTLPPHSSHKTQPLDVGLFKPFKCIYNACMDSWMMRHPGQPVTIYDVGALVGEAYQKSMTPTSITNAFKKTGIYPFDRNVFGEVDFLPSSVTDRPEPTENEEFNHTEKNKESEEIGNIPPTEFVSPSQFKPPIKAKPRTNNRQNKKKGRSLIATDTPEKEEILQNKIRKVQPKKKQKTVRKILQEISTSESDSSMVLERDDIMTDEDSDKTDDINDIENNEQLEPEDPIRDAIPGDFILVEFKGKRNFVYYVAKILALEENGYQVAYLRKKSMNQLIFSLPDVPDKATVLKWDIKMILPKPSDIGSTSRLRNSNFSFNFNFLNMDVR
ncbi:uncharacterized protein LOC129953377 [Eupeodes corollae]|uniref:uncharacterized protein LOC129953377 n=1 Tax=Eupeodes corollae TaxID=290404 RepID=UPI002490FD0D|nr:uncharacterized protein LOC129953377 [Eupeodes corollae]